MLVEGIIVSKMGLTPVSVGVMIAYNIAWAFGAVYIGEAIFGSEDESNLTYIGDGLYKDSTSNLWQQG